MLAHIIEKRKMSSKTHLSEVAVCERSHRRIGVWVVTFAFQSVPFDAVFGRHAIAKFKSENEAVSKEHAISNMNFINAKVAIVAFRFIPLALEAQESTKHRLETLTSNARKQKLNEIRKSRYG